MKSYIQIERDIYKSLFNKPKTIVREYKDRVYMLTSCEEGYRQEVMNLKNMQLIPSKSRIVFLFNFFGKDVYLSYPSNISDNSLKAYKRGFEEYRCGYGQINIFKRDNSVSIGYRNDSCGFLIKLYTRAKAEVNSPYNIYGYINLTDGNAFHLPQHTLKELMYQLKKTDHPQIKEMYDIYFNWHKNIQKNGGLTGINLQQFEETIPNGFSRESINQFKPIKQKKMIWTTSYFVGKLHSYFVCPCDKELVEKYLQDKLYFSTFSGYEIVTEHGKGIYNFSKNEWVYFINSELGDIRISCNYPLNGDYTKIRNEVNEKIVILARFANLSERDYLWSLKP